MYQCKNTEDMKDGTLRSARLCMKMDDLREEERKHQRDVWIENMNQDGFQRKPMLVRFPLRWEVTDRKRTRGLTNSWWH